MITGEILHTIDSHWAVQAVGNKKIRKSILNYAEAMLVKDTIGEQLSLNIKDLLHNEAELKQLALAYEMAAIEGMKDFINHTANDELSDQFVAGSYRAFKLNRVLKIDREDHLKFIFHLLHLSSLAYCGDCWTDLRYFYDKFSTEIKTLLNKDDDTWDNRILLRLFACWVGLFRKNSWKELNQISNSIDQLRQEQTVYERNFLNANSNNESQANAMRLMSLYHWAKATELLALYMLQGQPPDIKTQLDRHFNLAIDIASKSRDAQLEVLLRWLHASAVQMVNGSIWWVAQTINSKATGFIKNLAKRSIPLLELLPPQKTALKEMGLLDPAKTAVVVDMPTSGGKTLLAQFKILQAVNNFSESKGWVAYIAPTKALVNQIVRRLRQDFSPIGIQVEKLTGAIEIDAIEEDMLNDENAFDVLVATPEKMQLVMRNHKIKRQLTLLVMDEAHNIEDEKRGLRIELLMATVKQHYQAQANFLLLMPFVENTQTLSRWLADDRNGALSVSLSTSPWQPNERIIGLVKKNKEGKRGDWTIKYETLSTTPKTIHLKGKHQIGGIKPLNIAQSSVNLSKLVAACGKTFSERGTSIVIARTKNDSWSIARELKKEMTELDTISDDIQLVQSYLKTEVSPEFELIEMLNKGIGVHHAGLSDEIKSLMEWLAEKDELKVLCATTTIAQGINFPVSSMFLQSIKYPYGKKMSCREFWNLAGRSGRIGQDNIGVVGIACNSDEERDLTKFVKDNTGSLVSRLISLLSDLQKQGTLDNLEKSIYAPQWEDFRCYIAHLVNENKDLEATLNEMDRMLTNTFGYSTLKQDDPVLSNKLLSTIKQYTTNISDNLGLVAQADITGFSVESIKKAMQEIKQLEYQLTPSDWMPDSLFGSNDSKLPDLFSVMFEIDQLNFKHDEMHGRKKSRLADIARAWITGKTIPEIATNFFEGSSSKEISEVYKTIYSDLANGGTWGLSALSLISGLNFESLSEADKRRLNLIPAMLYHGVKTEASVLMRMNSLPRSVAEIVGEQFEHQKGEKNVATARKYLKTMVDNDWNKATSHTQYLTGRDCKKIWQILSGELDIS